MTWGARPKNSGGTSSFQDFQDSVRDAWDIEDDEFSVMSSGKGNYFIHFNSIWLELKIVFIFWKLEIRISKKVAQSAALNVINNHRTGNSPTVLSSTHPEVHQNHNSASVAGTIKPVGSTNVSDTGPNQRVSGNERRRKLNLILIMSFCKSFLTNLERKQLIVEWYITETGAEYESANRHSDIRGGRISSKPKVISRTG